MNEVKDSFHTYRIIYETSDLQKVIEVKGYVKLIYEIATIQAKGFTLLKVINKSM